MGFGAGRELGGPLLGAAAAAGLALSVWLAVDTALASAGPAAEAEATAALDAGAVAPAAEAAEGLAMSLEESRGRPDLLVRAMLEQIYRAFEEDEEFAVYDALAVVGGPDVISDLYLQQRAALVARNTQGATQELHALELESLDIATEENGFVFDVRWRVLGVIAHVTHSHMRGNAYSATLWTSRSDAGWRLDRFELRRIDRSGAGEIVENAE